MNYSDSSRGPAFELDAPVGTGHEHLVSSFSWSGESNPGIGGVCSLVLALTPLGLVLGGLLPSR